MANAKRLAPVDAKNHFTDNFINAFINGVSQTFKVMTRTAVHAETPILAEKLPRHGDIAGFVGLIGDQVQGMLLVSFDKEVLFYFLNQMFGHEYTEITDEVTDAVGEFTNIIYGGSKTILNDLGYHFDMAIPSVVAGATYFAIRETDQTLSIPFSSQSGRFILTITLREKQDLPKLMHKKA